MAEEGGNNNVFVYMGGNQEVPRNVTHVRIHKSVKIIRARAFKRCRILMSIEIHDGVEIIEEEAFRLCLYLRRIKLLNVRVIGARAFSGCTALKDVEFGDKLETIGGSAFAHTALRNIKLLKVRDIRNGAFYGCEQLTEVELCEDLERIEERVFFHSWAFGGCPRLRRIAIPLKDNLIGHDVFFNCAALSQVDIVGGIHKTVSSLFLESWKDEMNDEIEGINRDLPNTPHDVKTALIQQWMERVIRRVEHYKSEHYSLLKEDMSQLELALWDANLPNVDDAAGAGRHEARVTCGAYIIIPHVLSFLNDADVFPLLDCDLLSSTKGLEM